MKGAILCHYQNQTHTQLKISTLFRKKKRAELIDGQIYDITTWQSFLNTEPQVFENTGSSIH